MGTTSSQITPSALPVHFVRVTFAETPDPFQSAAALAFFLEHHVKDHGAVSTSISGQVQVAFAIEDDVSALVAADSIRGFLDAFFNKIWACPDWRGCVAWDAVEICDFEQAHGRIKPIPIIWDSLPCPMRDVV